MVVSNQMPYFWLTLLALLVVAPALGGMLLRLALRLLNVRNVTYTRCWMAYLAAYVAASLVTTLIANAGQSPGSIGGSDGQFVLMLVSTLMLHLIVVPLVLRTAYLRAILAHVLTLAVYGAALTAVVLPLVTFARAEARRTVGSMNMKMIGHALHGFHDRQKCLPAQSIRSDDGRPLLSWRVMILPWLDRNYLYDELKMDKPWDNPENRKLMPDMPREYADPGVPISEPFATRYQVFVQTETPVDPAKSPPFNPLTAGRGSRGPSLSSFKDGTSSTILAAESADPVPWTKPADMLYSPDKPLPLLGQPGSKGFHVLMADGSVRYINHDINHDVLRAMITHAAGDDASGATKRDRSNN
jgi:Protein of unknown function (DUF1559)